MTMATQNGSDVIQSFEVTGGQAALEERILEAIQAMPAPA